jgi:hypothetical protein
MNPVLMRPIHLGKGSMMVAAPGEVCALTNMQLMMDGRTIGFSQSDSLSMGIGAVNRARLPLTIHCPQVQHRRGWTGKCDTSRSLTAASWRLLHRRMRNACLSRPSRLCLMRLACEPLRATRISCRPSWMDRTCTRFGTRA